MSPYLSAYKAALPILKKWKSQNAQFQAGGNVYTVEAKADPDTFLDWDKPLAAQKNAEVIAKALEVRKNAGGSTAGGLFNNLIRARGTAAATAALAKAGIPGIRYLDEGSRGSQSQRTHNYVVFDPKILRVTHRNGQPLDGGASDAILAGDDFNPSEPRKTSGEWTAQGGSGAQKSTLGKNGIIAGNNPAKRPHVAHYDPKATQVDAQGVVHTTSVVDAARALYDGQKVDLNQPREVATLVDHLGQVAKHMIAMGDAAPNFNLCNVSVDNTNIFCAVSEGIPRINMPQLPPNLHPFLSFLGEKGIGFQPAMEKAGYLRATQNELIGAKVAAIAKALQNIDPRKLDPLVVSKDNYIVDGHHRWAAEVAISAEQGNFDRPLEIYRVNSDILTLLKLANDFTGGKGHVAGSLKPGEAALNLKTENHFLDGETHAHDARPFGLERVA